MPRKAGFVGRRVPLESSSAVFEAVGTRLGKLVKRVSDGETGARKDWIVWQADVFKNAEGLEPGSTRDLQGGYRFILYKVKPGETIEFGPLGVRSRSNSVLWGFQAGSLPRQNSNRNALSSQSPHADRGGDDILRPPGHCGRSGPYTKRVSTRKSPRWRRRFAPGPGDPVGHCCRDLFRPGKSRNGESDPDGAAGRLDCPS